MKRFRKKTDWVRSVGILGFLIVGLLSYLYIEGFFAPKGLNEIHFIDCGQGDSTLILSEKVVTLVDASTADGGEQIETYLKKMGIRTIDHFFLSHPHDDHMGGAERILDSFQVNNIYMMAPTKGTEPTAKFYLNFLKKIQLQNKKIHKLQVGEEIQCGEVRFQILGPVEEYDDLNNQSVIMRGQWGASSLLLTGDQERSAEKDLVKSYGENLQSTLLKVGHHGSGGSSSDAFLDAVAPRYAVISCGAENRYGHPHKEALDRLKERDIAVYRTDLHGSVVFSKEVGGFRLKEG